MFFDSFVFSESALPVELVHFSAASNDQDVLLQWQTASEQNNAGFEVQRLADGAFERIGYVDGAGTTTEAQAYSYTVSGMEPGRHVFRLKQVDHDGAISYSAEVEVEVGMTEAYRFGAAYPNPFNPQTRFTLAIQQSQHVEVAVMDLLGRRVALLHQGALDGGQAHTFTFEASALPSGVYLIRAMGEHFSTAQTVSLLK